MARPGITYLDVSNAAQQLVAAGRTPTIETIRFALGTGSNSTLGAHLRNWKAKQDQTQQIATKENIPEELISAIKGVWERVINQSEDRIQAIQQETHEKLIQLKQEMQRLQKDYATSQQQYQQCKQERDGLAHEKSVFEQLLSNAKIETAALIEKVHGFKQQNQEKQARIDELHRQNQQTQANLEHYRSASLEQRLADQQRYEHQQKQLEQMNQQINQELAQLQFEKLALQQQTQQVNFENDNLKTQLSKFETKHESMIIHLNDAVSELAKIKQDRQHFQDQHHFLAIKLEEQTKSFIDLQTKHAVLLQKSESNTAAIKFK